MLLPIPVAGRPASASPLTAPMRSDQSSTCTRSNGRAGRGRIWASPHTTPADSSANRAAVRRTHDGTGAQSASVTNTSSASVASMAVWSAHAFPRSGPSGSGTRKTRSAGGAATPPSAPAPPAASAWRPATAAVPSAEWSSATTTRSLSGG